MLFTLNQLSGASIASQAYVNQQISNLINSSPDLLNTLSEISNAINNDPNFNTSITNLISTKVGLTSNNTISGQNTFSNLPYYVNTSDQLINKNYVDTRFTNLLSNNNTFTGSNNFNSESGNIINRLFSTILSINNGNTRRNISNYFEVGMGQTSPYIFYDNSGKFGSINTNDSSLNWNIALNSVFTIKTINSVDENITGNGIVNNLYSNILSVNNGNTRRSTNDIMEIATSSTGNYLYYNNSSTFGFINVSDSNKSWFINQNGNLNIPIITSNSGSITTLSSNSGSITNLYSNILSINNGTSLRSSNDLFNVSISSTGNYLYYNNSGVFGHINTSNSNNSWSINSSGLASFPALTSGLSSLSTLAVGSSSVRGSGDLITVSVTPTGNYIYLNNGGVLGGYNTTGTPANFPWTINMEGLGSFRSISSLTGSINSLYSNILSINNGTSLRSANDLFNVSQSPSTGNYLYYNNSSAFGHINTSNSNNSWLINSSGNAQFPSLNTPSGTITTLASTTGTITNLYSDILAVNNNNTRRASNDIFEVATNSTGNYLYYNNTSVFGHINTSNSALSWYIDSNGLSSFKSSNVSGTSSIGTNLCIGSSGMRTSSDKLNVSLSSTGSYLFFNDGGTLGLYNTDSLSFPWFVEVDGDASFQSVSTPHLKATGKIKRERVVDSSNIYNVTNSTTSLTYLTDSGGLIVNLNVLDASNNFNMYEFRCTAANNVRFNANGVTLYDNLNASRSFISTTTQKYFKFHYIEQNGSYFYHQFV
jgi:hypothetical protein